MKRKAIKIRPVLWMTLAAVVAVPLLVFLGLRLEGTPPAVELSGVETAIGARQTLSVTVGDDKSGLRKVRIGLVKDGREVEIYTREFAAGGLLRTGKVRETTFDVPIAARKLGLSDGKALLRLAAWDRSWRGWWKGNQTYLEREVVIDTRPPTIDVLSRFHNVTRGGSGLAIYRLSEPCRESGVVVGDIFYPGHRGHFEDPNVLLAFFALGHLQDTDTRLAVRAMDMAGNKARSGFQYHLRRKKFRQDTINISDRFLKAKMPEFAAEPLLASIQEPLDRFLAVNRDLRQANYRRLLEVTGRTDAAMHWKGRFLRLPNAATRAGFADYRTYKYQGKVIDHQYHLGIDLASVARSPVPAANSGRIAFAGKVGIYGNTVVIDHGFGLFSLYSHLSMIEVQEDQQVAKGETLGRSGRSGLAGGDHLHFSMLVNGTFVNPIEWWDPAWIQNNIVSKIEAAADYQ